MRALTNLETYLITRGDSINTTLLLLFWICVVITLIALITSAAHGKVFSETENPSELDLKTASKAIKVFFNFAIYTLIILFIKSFTPRSQDILMMYGLNEITTEHLNKTSKYSSIYLKNKFPDLIDEEVLTENEIKLKKINKMLDSLKTVAITKTYFEPFIPDYNTLIELNDALKLENTKLKNVIDSLNNL